jgi:hypothetical protein
MRSERAANTSPERGGGPPKAVEGLVGGGRATSVSPAIAALGLLSALLISPAASIAAPQSAAAAGPIAMTDARFWSIVDSTRNDDHPRQIASLKAQLAALTPAEIEAFDACFARQTQRSNDWGLWGAAYVAMGGASDDGFEYFRHWLIARGHADFEKVLADPDALATIAPAEAEALEFEDFARVAAEAWSAKTGKPVDAMPYASSGDAISGTQFSEDPAALAMRYPKLWRRFGAGG